MPDDPNLNRDKSKPPEDAAAPDESAAGASAGLGQRDDSVDGTIYLAEANDATIARLPIGERMRAVVTQSAAGVRAYVIGAQVVPVAVRGPELPTGVTPAELRLPAEARQLLGPVQTHAVLGEGRLELWLSRLEQLPSDSVVTVIAATADGEPVLGELTLGDQESSRLRFTLSWPYPGPPVTTLIVVRLAAR